MVTKSLVGRIVVIHSEQGQMIVKIERTVCSPMLAVTDADGTEFLVPADDYERASLEEVKEFCAVRRGSMNRELAQWN